MAQLSPLPRQNAFNLGQSVPGALLYAWAAGGTVTARTTYYDSALTVANMNPLVADASGLFGPIFLTPGLGYLFELRTPGNVLIWQQDNVVAPASSSTSASVDNGICDFRLTLSTGVAVPSTDVTAATSVFLTPYKGDRIALSDVNGVTAIVASSTDVGIAIPAAASQMYDVFAYNNAGIPTLELVAWTNDTTRAVALVNLFGIYTKFGDLTRRYLGSVRTTTVAGQSEDSVLRRYLWNYYNRVRRPLLRRETTSSWTYTTPTWRQANGSAANQVAVVVGVAEATVDVALNTAASNTNSAVPVGIGIGENSTSAISTSCIGGYAAAAVSNVEFALTSRLSKYPAIGLSVYAWLEISVATGTTLWLGGPQFTNQASGLSGSIEA